MKDLRIRRALPEDAKAAAGLADLLWSPSEEREAEFRGLIDSADSAVFLAEADGQAVGFAQCGLRRDYVEGKDSDGPVGYLEGIYVDASCRGKGIARKLMAAAQQWAKDMGCHEFASDCELNNQESLAFHLACGFEEANRIICFIKSIDE